MALLYSGAQHTGGINWRAQGHSGVDENSVGDLLADLRQHVDQAGPVDDNAVLAMGARKVR